MILEYYDSFVHTGVFLQSTHRCLNLKEESAMKIDPLFTQRLVIKALL